MNIKDIIKEEVNDFKWMEDVPGVMEPKNLTQGTKVKITWNDDQWLGSFLGKGYNSGDIFVFRDKMYQDGVPDNEDGNISRGWIYFFYCEIDRLKTIVSVPLDPNFEDNYLIGDTDMPRWRPQNFGIELHYV